jgi:hypothetical protein
MGTAVLFLGVLLLGLLAGTLAGISASPVVGPLLPLLFALLSTGGGFWYLKSSTGSGWDRTSQRKALLLGLQLIVFVLGFAPGLWLGAAAKLHSDRIWHVDSARHPSYGSLKFTDVRLLEVVIRLDAQMERGGLAREQRQRILEQLVTTIAKRASAEVLSANDVAALTATLASLGASPVKDEGDGLLHFRDPVAIEVPPLDKFFELLNEEKGHA